MNLATRTTIDPASYFLSCIGNVQTIQGLVDGSSQIDNGKLPKSAKFFALVDKNFCWQKFSRNEPLSREKPMYETSQRRGCVGFVSC